MTSKHAIIPDLNGRQIPRKLGNLKERIKEIETGLWIVAECSKNEKRRNPALAEQYSKAYADLTTYKHRLNAALTRARDRQA